MGGARPSWVFAWHNTRGGIFFGDWCSLGCKDAAMQRPLLLLAFSLGCRQPNDEVDAVAQESTESAEPSRESELSPAPEVIWLPAPHQPNGLGHATRPRVVELKAAWCQWCRVFEHEILPDPRVRRVLAQHFEALTVDIEQSPAWMDLPGVEGLPTLVFFDAAGRHVLSRSGYREASELESMLDAIARGLVSGEVAPYPAPVERRRLDATSPIDTVRARAELVRLEGELFLRVNSHDGGFGTPSRDPQPATLLALQRWRSRSDRAEQWIALTIRHALRGSSPRLLGEPLRELELAQSDLVALSGRGPLDPRWAAALENLPQQDPYRGLQDPVDHGVFRYCAGPGWYHPHFERRASDNLAWALLLRERGEVEAAAAIHAFVETTFGAGARGGLDAAQRSDPFHARLRASERVGIAPPHVDSLTTLSTQALAAQYDPARCSVLLALPRDAWPPALWPATSGRGEPASPDAVGETLLALAGCPDGSAAARELGEFVIARWREQGFEPHPRLTRLAAGVCRARPADCKAALGAIEGLPIDLDFPAPLHELARIAGHER